MHDKYILAQFLASMPNYVSIFATIFWYGIWHGIYFGTIFGTSLDWVFNMIIILSRFLALRFDMDLGSVDAIWQGFQHAYYLSQFLARCFGTAFCMVFAFDVILT